MFGVQRSVSRRAEASRRRIDVPLANGSLISAFCLSSSPQSHLSQTTATQQPSCPIVPNRRAGRCTTRLIGRWPSMSRRAEAWRRQSEFQTPISEPQIRLSATPSPSTSVAASCSQLQEGGVVQPFHWMLDVRCHVAPKLLRRRIPAPKKPLAPRLRAAMRSATVSG
jgi:hypothetical protein